MNELHKFDLPESVSRALIRLESALKREGIEAMRTNYHDGAMQAFVDDDRGYVHYITRHDSHWYECLEVG